MHDIYPTTIDAAIRTVDRLLDAGFTFVTISELLQIRHGEAIPGRVYHHGRP